MKPPNSETPFSCILLGSESLLIQCGEILHQAGHDIRAVVSRNPQIIRWAGEHEIPTLLPDRDLYAGLLNFEFDHLFSITHLSIIKDEILALAGKAAINFHDGPLPAYAGMYAPVWALLRGETEYGIAFHEMSQGVDEGPIYVERRFAVEPRDTSLALNTRCYEAAIDAFSELVENLANETATPAHQDRSRRSYFGRHDRPAHVGILEFDSKASDLDRLVRALDFGRYENPFGAAAIVHQGKVCLVGSAKVSNDSPAPGSTPGQVLDCTDTGLTIAVADGVVSLSDFTCLRGVALTPAQAAEHLGVASGDCLDAPVCTEDGRLEAALHSVVRNESFWVRRLADLRPLTMPMFETGSDDSNQDPQSIDFEIPEAFRALNVDGSGGAVAGAFAALLSRLSDQPHFDLAYSDDAIAQTHIELGEFFAPCVPFRVDVEREASTRQVFERIASSLEKTQHHGAPLTDLLVRYPKLAGLGGDTFAGFGSVSVVSTEDPTNPLVFLNSPMTLVAGRDASRARLIFDRSRVNPQDAQSLCDRFGLFMSNLASAWEEPFGTVPILDETERAQLLDTWNASATPFDRDRCVHDLIVAKAKETPGATALVCEGTSIEYGELLDRSGRLANHLISLGVEPDDLVAVHLDRSIDMVVAVVAILRAGAAYVPLDPAYPQERLAHMLRDSKARIIVSDGPLAEELRISGVHPVSMTADAHAIAQQPESVPQRETRSDNLAYVIYTSGSTGLPKGVMLEHRNVTNFFAGMDARVPHETPGTWLAVTSLSFDISVLELLWTLARGFEVVIQRDAHRAIEAKPQTPWRPMDFGLAMWGSEPAAGEGTYDLMLECARFGDQNGFSSFHTPERHFASFGGSYPNPSVTSAAVAAVTSNIKICSASCVVPLHHPVRVAEEWAVVDNLSGGRVEIAFASGWQPNDFVIKPENHGRAKEAMFESADIVRKLWRGEAVEFENPMGEMIPTSTQPRPIQPELESWITTAGNVETFEMAGRLGYNVLTHLLGQSIDETAKKIAAYRRARKEAGLDPATGRVTLMLHTHVGEDNDVVRERVRQPMKSYLASAVSLVMGYAWTFPAFARPGGPDSKPEDIDLSTLSEEEVDTILEFAFERYYETSGLFGTPEICAEMVDRCRGADVNEICCLVDFGLSKHEVVSGLKYLNEVRHSASIDPGAKASEHPEPRDYAFAAQVERHTPTHLQCTPTMAQMLLMDPDTKDALGRIEHLMIGGEAFPPALAKELEAIGVSNVTNMYGPTETTIWSSTAAIEGSPDRISIGEPIANTTLYVMDRNQQLLPAGFPGELVIGGEGVARGYFARPELTGERFVPDPFSSREGARLYRTGDLACRNADGSIEILGRMDQQIKLRGHRIELGEIEARVSELPEVQECVVAAREVAGSTALVAYLVPRPGSSPTPDRADRLAGALPDFMVPQIFVELASLPQTPNGKLDRNALPAPDNQRQSSNVPLVAPEGEVDAMLAEIWRNVLRLDEVGIDDNFFDLGGHSLLVVQAHRQLRDAWPEAVSLTDLYRFPTIRKLAAFLTSKGSGEAEADTGKSRGEQRRKAMGRRRRRATGRTGS